MLSEVNFTINKELQQHDPFLVSLHVWTVTSCCLVWFKPWAIDGFLLHFVCRGSFGSVDWTLSVVFIIVTQWGLSGGPFLVPGSSAGRNLPLGEGYLSRIWCANASLLAGVPSSFLSVTRVLPVPPMDFVAFLMWWNWDPSCARWWSAWPSILSDIATLTMRYN